VYEPNGFVRRVGRDVRRRFDDHNETKRAETNPPR
jgi:hypothetical protein